MKISTRGRYALRIVLDLATYGQQTPVSRGTLAERQEISPDYIAQILVKLREANIVQSARGPGGGYQLTQDGERSTAGDVVRAVEGPTRVVYCVEEPIDPPCPRSDDCAARWMWTYLSSEIDRVLDSLTLDDLVRVGKQLQAGDSVSVPTRDSVRETHGGARSS